MSTVLGTGSAALIGSQITEACIARGDRVIGVDSFTDYYDVDQKRSNVAASIAASRFELVERDVTNCVGELLDGAAVVIHQAGQPGVRCAWREQLDECIERNIRFTQRLFEAALRHRLPRLVHASSASVYSEHGDVARTDALTERAAQTLGWMPVVDLPSGLRHQHEWHRSR